MTTYPIHPTLARYAAATTTHELADLVLEAMHQGEYSCNVIEAAMVQRLFCTAPAPGSPTNPDAPVPSRHAHRALREQISAWVEHAALPVVGGPSGIWRLSPQTFVMTFRLVDPETGCERAARSHDELADLRAAARQGVAERLLDLPNTVVVFEVVDVAQDADRQET